MPSAPAPTLSVRAATPLRPLPDGTRDE